MENLSQNQKLSQDFLLQAIDFLKKKEAIKAKHYLEKSINLDPKNVSALYYLSVVEYYNFGKKKIAQDILKSILEIEPNHCDSICLLAKIFFHKNLQEEGIKFFLSKKYLSEEIIFGVAYIHYLGGKIDKTISILEDLIKLDRSDKRISYIIYSLLGHIFYATGKHHESLDCFIKSVEINKYFAKGYFLIAKIYKFFSNIYLSDYYFDRCIEIEKNNLNCLIEKNLSLPHIYKDHEEFKNFRDRYSDGLNIIGKSSDYVPYHNEFVDNQTFLLSYGKINNLNLLKYKSKVFRKLYPKLNHTFKFLNSDFSSKIRIGFISQYLTNHTIGKLFSGIIANLDKSKFEIILFHSSLTRPGKIKFMLDNSVSKSITLPLDFDGKVKIIKDQRLDIIFYPDIGMSTDLYYLTFLKLAKTQINTWGHPETSGNLSIDYFISSQLCEIENAQDFYSENLIKFNNFSIFHETPLFNKINYDFNGYKNYNVYGCFQSVFKILPEFDLIIKKILDQDKKAIILFVKDEYEVWYKILLKRWSVSIKDNLERIKFVDKLSESDFINISGLSKVLLDPIYFGSGNSFIETFQHGTPMVTWPNNFLKTRLALGLYKQMNILDAPIADSIDSYVNLSVELANNHKKNLNLRTQIIENSKKYFFNNHQVIKEYEDFFINCVDKNR